MNIFVGSLSFNTTEEELLKEFNAFGEVRSVKIILDHETLKSRGFAFVTMQDPEQANAAIAGLNGKMLNGFALKVNEARPREPGGAPNRERGRSSSSGNQSGSGYGAGSGSAGGGYKRDRIFDYGKDSDIYDTKPGRNGNRGSGRKDRGSGGHGSGRNGGRRSW